MVLEKLLTTAQIMKALSGQPDTAVLQEKAIAANDSTKTVQYEETSENKHETILKLNSEVKTGNCTTLMSPVNRTEATITTGSTDIGVTYDRKDKKDVGRLSLTNKSKGINFYRVGDGNKDDVFYSELWKSIALGDNTLLLDGGFGHGKMTAPQYFGFVKFSNKKSSVGVQFFNTGKELLDLNSMPNTSLYFYAGKDIGNVADIGEIYLGIGKSTNKLVGVTGVKGNKDFGMLNYFLINNNMSWEVKSLISFKDANSGVYNKDFMEYVGEIFSLDPFFMPNFTKTQKGEIGAKITAKGNLSQTELELLVGSYNAVLPFSIGVNNLSKDGKNNSNIVLEAFKDFNILGIGGYVEARYNARTGEINGYLVTKFDINLTK